MLHLADIGHGAVFRLYLSVDSLDQSQLENSSGRNLLASRNCKAFQSCASANAIMDAVCDRSVDWMTASAAEFIGSEVLPDCTANSAFLACCKSSANASFVVSLCHYQTSGIFCVRKRLNRVAETSTVGEHVRRLPSQCLPLSRSACARTMWNCHSTTTSPTNIETMMSAKHRSRRGPMLSRSRFILVQAATGWALLELANLGQAPYRRRGSRRRGLARQHRMQCLGIRFGDRPIVRSGHHRRPGNASAPSRIPGLAPPGIDMLHHKWNFKVLDLSAWRFNMSGGPGLCLFAK